MSPARSTPRGQPDGSVSLHDQIRCVRRELALRERAYPRWIAAGKLSPMDAKLGLMQMRAVLDTLEQIQAAL